MKIPDPRYASVVSGRIAAVMRLFVGPDRPYSDAMVAEELGSSERTVQSHRLGQNSPTLANFLAYTSLFGASFAAPILELAGITGLRSAQDGPISPGVALKELAEATASLAAANADGCIDHLERPSVLRELRDAAAAIEQMIQQLEGQ